MNKIDKKLISQIRDIRAKNNKNWMRLLEIAFEFSPKESRMLMGKITENDMSISKLSKKLAEGK